MSFFFSKYPPLLPQGFFFFKNPFPPSIPAPSLTLYLSNWFRAPTRPSKTGQHTKAKLQTISITGGLLRIARSLSQGDFVEVAFQIQGSSVRGMAEMLSPVRAASEGSLQPFRFVALGDGDHRALRMAVDSVTDRSFLGIRSGQWSAPKLI